METDALFYYGEMESPIGCLTMVVSDHGLCHLQFGSWESALLNIKTWMIKHSLKQELVEDETKVAEVQQQLTEYFQGERHMFQLPLDLHGTPFQKKVWDQLRQINYGDTISYKELATLIGAPKAVRAVGGANNKNPIPIIIPCHRVIGANGALVGYGGGLEIKQDLLSLETNGIERLTS